MAGEFGEFNIETRQGSFRARQVVSAVPMTLTAKIAPKEVQSALRPYIDRDAKSLGGAVVVFLGVPEEEVASQSFTHHQLLHDYSETLGNGNNMFISISAASDTQSAPAGHRTVMISTHCELRPWEGLSPPEYDDHKQVIAARLIDLARKVYPNLGRRAVVYEVGTPCTYERFTHRPRGAVGGVQQNLQNSNQAAVPHRLGCRGFWHVGDTTWPGLGTVACVLGSRIVAEGILKQARRRRSNARMRISRDLNTTTRADNRARVA